MIYSFDKILERRGTLCTKWDNLRERMGREDVLALWVADCEFPCSEPIVRAISARAAHPVFGYSFVPPDFYIATKDWVAKRHGWTVDTDCIRFFPGIVPFIGVCIRALTNPGERILIQPPVYHPFATMIRENQREVCRCPLRYTEAGYAIDFRGLEEKLSSPDVTMMILCNPHNPVGRVYRKEELEKISALCVQYGVRLVSDEIHSDVIYSGHKHIPVASLNAQAAENTVTCISPSKAFNIAGLKASGILIPNPEIREVIDAEISRVHVSTPNAFAMAAYLAAYRESEDYLDQMIAYLEENRNFLDRWLRAHMPKIRLVPAEGTYLMWLDCTELGLRGDKLHEFFLNEAHVAVNKGEIFGLEGASFVRMNIACPRSMLQEALERIQRAYEASFSGI